MERVEHPASVLVVEDEADMARILQVNLTGLGHRVLLASTAAEAARKAANETPDLVLLDLRLPDGSGLDLLQAWRAVPPTAAMPVIVVSALGDEETVVQALTLGADDYVTKPFRTGELGARVGAVLRRRRAEPGAPAPAAFGPIVLDPATREVRVEGVPVEFTRSEFDILAYFVANAGLVRTRRQICHEALGSGGSILERTVDAHIRTIRRKLGAHGRCIVTVWGVGYRLVNPP